jgi:tRNA(Ile)-lysidine synthase
VVKSVASLQEQTLAFIRAEQLVVRGDKILVGVSGGADSMALLLVLCSLRAALAIEVIAVHFDHHLRKNSSQDVKVVRQMAEQLGSRLISAVNSVPYSGRGSLEDFAREQRYAFFKKVYRQTGAHKLCVAHTRDDLAETVLMRVLRGSGLYGLRSILPKRSLMGMNVLRPFLFATREDIEGFLAQRKVSYLEDPTNSSLAMTRNRVRREVIPFLEKMVQPGIKNNLARLGLTAGVDHDYIAGKSSVWLTRWVKVGPGKGAIPLGSFVKLHQSVRREVLRQVYAAVKGDLKTLTLDHVDAMDALAREGRADSFFKVGRLVATVKKLQQLLEIKCARV